MAPGPGETLKPRGFTLIELIIVVAAIAIMAVVTIPYFSSFIKSQQAQGAARELASLLNQARQLAITRNSSYSVEVQTDPNNRVRFCKGTTTPCTADIWTGPGTDGNGWVRLANDAKIACRTADPKFAPLGNATQGATIRVQNAQGDRTFHVVVSVSGRIQTSSTGTCP